MPNARKGRESTKFIDRVGEIYLTNQGYWVKIIECFGALNCTIQFENGLIVRNKRHGDIVRGKVNNPYHPSVCDVGYMGVGKYSNKTHRYIHVRWTNIVSRYQLSTTYKKASTCEEWKCFQNFAPWFEENWKPYMDSTWDIEKDIIIKGNKIYSPETCCLVPHEINMLFTSRVDNTNGLPTGVNYDKTGTKYTARIQISKIPKQLGTFDTIEEAFQAYKVAKEAYIKEIANKWRGKITERCYWAMMNYIVEITD